MLRFTKGFAKDFLLEIHFRDHKSDFNVASEEEYLELADKFWEDPPGQDVRECTRQKNGDRIRYNIKTREYGVLTRDGVIKTYFKPVPRGGLTTSFRTKSTHDEPTNEDYFHKKCNEK